MKGYSHMGHRPFKSQCQCRAKYGNETEIPTFLALLLCNVTEITFEAYAL